MSEEEIISRIKDYENWRVVYNPGGLYRFIPLSEHYKEAIQGLLELYKQEKEKNKELSEKVTQNICNRVEAEVLEEYRLKVQNSISKDKIKEKIEGKIAYCRAEELEDSYIGDKHSQYWGMYRELLEKLEQELLEERN